MTINITNQVPQPVSTSKNNITSAQKEIAIVSSTTLAGMSIGFIKNKLIDAPDVRKGLADEFEKCSKAIDENKKNIKDSDLLKVANQKLKDEFNNLAAYCEKALKKTNKKNLIVGGVIGLVSGLTGIFIKKQINESNGK